jgi:hypothetical protein
MELLQRGSHGPKVRALQHALNARPYIAHLDEDGIFGKNTEAAVKEFQRKVHLKDDGIYGPKTEAALWARVADTTVTLQVPVANVPPPGPQRQLQPPKPPVVPAPPQPQTPQPASSSSGGSTVRQLSAGSQVTFTPWYMRPSPAPGTPTGNIWSGIVSFALVYRTSNNGPHVELSLNPQILINSRVLTTDPRWSLQLNGQITFADLLVAGRFHLISPFIQATIAGNADPGVSLGGGFALGNQVSFDLIPDRLQINLNGGAAAQWTQLGTKNSSLGVGGQAAAGLLYQW